MKRGIAVLAVVLIAAMALAGCGNFQQRATEIKTSIENAEASAQLAEEAAAHNRGRLLELERRVSDLEAVLDEMRTIVHEKEDTP